MQSGTSLNIWARSRVARKTAFEVGKKLNINTDSSRTLLAKLKQVPYKKLQEEADNVAREVISYHE